METIRGDRLLIIVDDRIHREILVRGLGQLTYAHIETVEDSWLHAKSTLQKKTVDKVIVWLRQGIWINLLSIQHTLDVLSVPFIVVVPSVQEGNRVASLGAFQVLVQPDMYSPQSVRDFVHHLKDWLQQGTTVRQMRLIAIGASTGGTEAIYQVLRRLPNTLPGIVIVQHIPPGFSRRFAERLNAQTDIVTKEAQTGDIIEDGHAYVAPGDQHMVVMPLGDQLHIECTKDDRVNGHRPSVDVLFHAVAKSVGPLAIGVILTGMGADGARGLLSMRQKGAYTIGQDESSSVVYGMPRAAFDMGAVQLQASLLSIPSEIQSIVSLSSR